MAQQYDNEGRIAVFKNDKGGNEKRPDYRGKATIKGVDYKLSLWIKEQKDGSGKKYMSGKIEPDEQNQSAPSAPAGAGTKPHEESPDVPF